MAFFNVQRFGDIYTVYQDVTFDSSAIDNHKPLIEDNVCIYAHACVVGNVVLHNNVFVGTTAFVNIDVPTNYFAVGVSVLIRPIIKRHN